MKHRKTGMEFSKQNMLIKDANMPLLAITVTRGGRVLDIFDNIIMENEYITRIKFVEIPEPWCIIRLMNCYDSQIYTSRSTSNASA